MISVGTMVRWRPDVVRDGPIGKITSYRDARTAEIDGRGWFVSVSLLEPVDMLDDQDPIDPMLAVIEQQLELIDDLRGELKDATDEIEGLREYPDAVVDCLEGYLLSKLGQRRPLTIQDPDLAELARAVFDGGD